MQGKGHASQESWQVKGHASQESCKSKVMQVKSHCKSRAIQGKGQESYNKSRVVTSQDSCKARVEGHIDLHLELTCNWFLDYKIDLLSNK